jgi:L-amino acid N-acyltransferase YncA
VTPSSSLRIRPAAAPDVAAITEIYNDAVRTTTGTFDTEPRSVEDRAEWFRGHGVRQPILVAEAAGRIVGWGSVSAWSDRKAYDGTGEVSVYVEAPARGQGTGRRLLNALIDAAMDHRYHTLIARIAEGNDASLRLHAAAGFSPAGVMRGVGVKFGRRLDVHLVQRMLPEPEASAEGRPTTGGPPRG